MTSKKPGYNAYNLPLSVFQQKWLLTTQEKSYLTLHFLRSWTLQDLLDHVDLNEKGEIVIPLFYKQFEPIYDKVDIDWQTILYAVVSQKATKLDVHNKMPKFWLSFRSGWAEGREFNYVIVQKDSKP